MAFLLTKIRKDSDKESLSEERKRKLNYHIQLKEKAIYKNL